MSAADFVYGVFVVARWVLALAVIVLFLSSWKAPTAFLSGGRRWGAYDGVRAPARARS